MDEEVVCAFFFMDVLGRRDRDDPQSKRQCTRQNPTCVHQSPCYADGGAGTTEEYLTVKPPSVGLTVSR
jgi:hypothetical protein